MSGRARVALHFVSTGQHQQTNLHQAVSTQNQKIPRTGAALLYECCTEQERGRNPFKGDAQTVRCNIALHRLGITFENVHNSHILLTEHAALCSDLAQANRCTH